MANRYPLVIDTTNGNNFAELPEGDNLLLTNSSIVNALNISAVGNIAAGALEVNGVSVTGDYNDLQNLPDIPETLTDLGIADGSAGYILQANGDGTFSFVSRQAVNVGNFEFTDNVMTVASGDTEIHSPSNLVLYPTDNIWISAGTKLIFEGTAPDDFEAKLQATTVTADRDIILPDEDGTIATREWINSQGFTLDSTIQSIANDVSQLQIDVSSNDSDIGGLQSSVSGLQSSVSGLQSSVSGLSSQVSSISGNVSSNTGRISSLESRVNTAELDIDANLSSINNIQSTLSSLSIPSTLLDLGITDGAAGQALITNGDGTFEFVTISGTGSGNVFVNINADIGTTTADVPADSLTIAGGTDISTTIIGDTLTIDYTGTGGGATTLGALTDVDFSILPADGDVLTYNATAGAWIPQLPLGGGSQNVFANIEVLGQTTVSADTTTDTLTLIAGTGITLTTDSAADSITIAAIGGGGTYDQSLNTTDDVEFNSITSTTTVTANDFVSTGTGIPTITSASNIILDAANTVVIQGSPVRLSVYTTAEATALAAQAGDTIYVSDGDAGSPCLAVHDGSSWKRVSLGSTISSV